MMSGSLSWYRDHKKWMLYCLHVLLKSASSTLLFDDFYLAAKDKVLCSFGTVFGIHWQHKSIDTRLMRLVIDLKVFLLLSGISKFEDQYWSLRDSVTLSVVWVKSDEPHHKVYRQKIYLFYSSDMQVVFVQCILYSAGNCQHYRFVMYQYITIVLQRLFIVLYCIVL